MWLIGNLSYGVIGFSGRINEKYLEVSWHLFVSWKVLNEADIDGDHRMSMNEFEHVITKSPDFLSTFHFRI